MFRNICIDINVFCDGNVSIRKLILYLFLSTDFKAVMYYRVSSWCYRHKMKLIAYYIEYLAKKKFGVELSPIAKIGPGFRLVHSLGTVIGNKVVIGSFCTIYQQVTIGTSNAQRGEIEYPKIGNHVIIYSGAKVLGDINIGEHSVVAANAVVISNVEPYSVVGGIPAKLINKIRH